MAFAVGALVKARGREWVVLPESAADLLVLRPLGGTEDEVTGIYLPLEPVEPAEFELPDPSQPGDYRSCRLLRDAVRLGFRSSAGPFRAFARIAVEPRPYQLVPLLLALRLDPVRLLIADDVGIGKTIEACLIARELLDRGEIERLAVLCSPQLAPQWQNELRDKFHIDAEIVLPGTVTRLERNCRLNQSIFDLYPHVIVSTDFIKADRRRDEFLRACPEMVIVDEAHTCAYGYDNRGGRHHYYRQLLRLVYRLLFLFVAEDRDLLLRPDADPQARERYERFYSLSRLRLLAEKRVGTRHADLYHGLRLIMDKLGSDAGCPALGLPALGSFLFSREAIPDLEACDIANAYLLDAVRALAFINDRHGRRLVDYKNLRSEELGSVYEALLELLPDVHIEALQFDLKTVSGSERKSTGSYYTPESLVQCLLDSALEPVVAEALNQPDAAQAILRLKVCDPACGSGHFLIAAAHRLAKHVASVRTGDDEPAPEAVRTALRDVIGHCIYGVDANPMAVELCKVSLWMEALEPGKPLSFLDHRIQCGNSLIGATPALLKHGIPDDAFKPIEGDDRTVCSEYRKHNKQEREGQQRLFTHAPEPWTRLGNLATGLLQLEEISDDSIAGVRRKQERWEELVRSQGYIYSRLWADAWCAAFVWKKIRDHNLLV